MKFNVIYIDEDSVHFDQVKKLWRINSKTLGFFPDGAFKAYAADECILVAETGQKFAGYLLFRKIKGQNPFPQAAIVHLCIDKQYRQQGVAKFLVEELCTHIHDKYSKLRITCRKDYNLDEFWIKLGFQFKNEITGRGGYPLFKWERVFREIPLPLLDLIKQLQKPKKYQVVIDANVCFRLQDPLPVHQNHDYNLSQEAKALEADWLKEDLELCITGELSNEIQKNSDKGERNHRITYIHKFNKLPTDFAEVNVILRKLRKFFPSAINDNARSDMYQLAHTIAGECAFFVTQDVPLLKKADAINNALGVTIISPGELISHIDELNSKRDYYPKRLAGSNSLQFSRLSADQVEGLYEHFRKNSIAERKAEFLNQIRTFLSSPGDYEQILYRQVNQKPIAFVVCDKRPPDILRIPIIRTAKSNSARTVLRYLIRSLVVKATQEKRKIIIITDMEGQDDFFEKAFVDNYFTKSNEKWVKINLFSALTPKDTLIELSHINDEIESVVYVTEKFKKVLLNTIENDNLNSYVELEKNLYPLKIIGSEIPTYVIPIKPVWAQNLFDETLANQTIWGANENLTMRLENVFYRSKISFGKIVFPSRILWYVTKEKSTKGSKMIRACSYIEDIQISKATYLYKKFQKYGVYSWKNISELVNGKKEEKIMAIVFNNSQLLSNPVSLEKYTEIATMCKQKPPVVRSPQRITEEIFFKIYSEGTA